MSAQPIQPESKTQEYAGRILELIHTGKTFLITSQLDPDGDSVGAQLALRRVILAELGPEAASRVAIVNQVGCPKRYAFLDDTDKIVTPADVAGRTFDVGFVLDGGVDRTGTCRPLFEACRKKVIIDHHKTTQASGYDVPFIEPAMSSTAEMVFTLIDDERTKCKLDRSLASQIYLGIIYDTGSFSYALTTARTHRIAARLLEEGIRHADIAERVMLESPLNAKILLGRTLNDMRISDDGRIASTSVTQKLATETRTTDEDVRGIITQMIFIEGVKVALLFYERDAGKVKLSLRSREGFDVANFARQLDPGGGGHARAAGCSVSGPLDTVRDEVLARLATALAAA